MGDETMNRHRFVYLFLFMTLLIFFTGCATQQPVNSSDGAPQTAANTIPATPKTELTFPTGVPVLMYHSISQEKNNDAVISPERFTDQMEFLYKEGYNPVSLEQLYDYLTGQKGLPSKPVVITFDDGYRDTYEIALPVLKRYGFKSTLFIITADAERRLTWKELAEMKAAGMDIASHSYTHRELGGMNPQQQAEEIVKSKEALDRNLKQDTRFFSFPNSSYSPETLRLLQEKGFKLAVTTEPGWAKPSDYPLALKRIWVGNSVEIHHFSERLTKEDYSIL